MNKVLVLLASFNGEKYLEEQIVSIFNQNECNISLVISDDSSTDKSIEIINKLKLKYPSIKLIENKNKISSSSQNFYNLFVNVELDNYDYIALSDQDDIFNNDKFVTAINFLKGNKFQGFSSSVKCFGLSNKILKQSNKINKLDFLFEGAGQGCTFVIRKDIFSNFQKFIIKNSSLIKKFEFHDWLLYLFVRSSKQKWKFFSTPLVNYRIHNLNLYGNKYSYLGLFIRFQKLFNGWYFDQVMLANKISRIIDPNIPNFNFLSLPSFLLVMIKNGLRKLSDRLIANFTLLFWKFLIKFKNIK